MQNQRATIARELLPAVPALMVFIWLAVAVSHSPGLPMDGAVRGIVHGWASSPLTAVMTFFTGLGSGWFLWPFGALICLRLARDGRRSEAALFAAATIGGNLLDEAMKMVFHRARPEPFFGYSKPDTYSFPSGHAFVSICFFLTLAEVTTEPNWSKGRKAAIWSAAIAISLCIGLSRIYLGVHYPSDVLGGYAGAIAWTVTVHAAHRRWRAPSDLTAG